MKRHANMPLGLFDGPIMDDEDMDMEMEMEMAALDDEDLLEYGIKIRDSSELLESDSEEEAAPEPVAEAPDEPQKTSPNDVIANNNAAQPTQVQWKEPTYTLDMHLFHKRKDKPPLYLLNPDDYPHDPQKQLQIRRATITYRHHQEKKELIRRQAQEIANLKSVLDIYSQREDAMAQFCTCDSALKIIKDFDPKKYLIHIPPPQKTPLPPIRRPGRPVDLSPLPSLPPRPTYQISNGSIVQGWTQNGQTSFGVGGNRTIILRKPQVVAVTPPTPPAAPKTAFEALKAQRAKDQMEQVLRSHQERLNRLQSPIQQATNPLPNPIIKREPLDSIEEVSATVKNTEVELILQQMNLAQMTSELQTQRAANNSAGVKPNQQGNFIQLNPSTSNPSRIILRPPTSTSALVRTGLRIQTPNGIRILPPTGVGYIPPNIVNQLAGGRATLLSRPAGMQGIPPPPNLKIISQTSLSSSQTPRFMLRPIKLESGGYATIKSATDVVNKQVPVQPVRPPATNPPLLIPKTEPEDVIEIDCEEAPITEQETEAQAQVSVENGTSVSESKHLSNGATNVTPEVITEELPISPDKIKEEPLDESSSNQRRSQRSAAQNRPNAKDLLKGIINKTARASTGSRAGDASDEVTYAQPCKKSKQSI